MMTLRQEQELKAKGYRLGQNCKSYDEAKQAAKELREQGYKARAVEYSTAVAGIHEYCIWYR